MMTRIVGALRKPWGVAAALAAGAALATALAGCGSTAILLHPGGGGATVSASPTVAASAVRVIRGWSEALRGGRVTEAAHYFQVPSLFFDGSGPPVELRSLRQVEATIVALPCGARLLSTHVEGYYVNALFRLSNRPGAGGEHGCGSGTGQTARTDFLIRGGRIVQWLRAPDEPGDNGSRRAPGATPDGGTQRA